MRLHETRIIDKPVDEVFAFTADFSNIDQWDPGIEAVEKQSAGPVGVGTTYLLQVRLGSGVQPMTYEVTEFDQPKRVVLVGTGETLTAVDVIEFSETEGGTLVDYTADLTFHNWLRFGGFLVAPLIRRVGTRALDGLVEALS